MSDGDSWVNWALLAVAVGVLLYLVRVNRQLSGTPEEVRRLSRTRWTPDLLKATYEKLDRNPMDYAHKLPPKLDRRYVVTGGSGEFLSAVLARYFLQFTLTLGVLKGVRMMNHGISHAFLKMRCDAMRSASY